jgi:predicted RND superfamily exporter protein
MSHRSRLIYAVIVLVTALGFYLARNITVETDQSGYNLASVAAREQFEAIQARFAEPGPGQSVLILEHDIGWNSLAALRHQAKILDFWQAMPGVTAVSGITNVVYPRQAVLVVKKEPFLNLKDEDAFAERLQEWEAFRDITGKFISADKRYALLFIATENGSGLSEEAIRRFNQSDLLTEQINVHYLQNDLIAQEVKRLTRNDAVQLAIISTLFILLSFYLLTRSLRGLLLILLMVAFNLALTLMFMMAAGIPFTVHMITIPCIVIVLSFTDIMHILYHQRLYIASGADGSNFRQQIIKSVQLPMLATSLTNMVGFLVFLILSENEYLSNFALVSIVGVFIAFLSSRLLIIHVISPERPLIKRTGFSGLAKLHDGLSAIISKQSRLVMIVLAFLTLMVISLISFQFTIDSAEGDLMAKESPLTRAGTILKEEFFGDKQAEVIIEMKGEELWSTRVIHLIDSLEADITQIFSPAYIESPALAVRRYRRFQRNGHPEAFTLPIQMTRFLKADLERYGEVFGAGSLVSTDRKLSRISFGFANAGLEASRRQYRELEERLRTYESKGLSFELTGSSYLSDQGSYKFTIKIIIGLLVGIVFASLLTFAFIKSFRQSLVLIFVNLFPVLTVLALMLMVGIAITPLTLFFLSLLAGICVDDSIYIVMQQRRAVQRLHIFPIIITSVVLAVGFIALGFSNFLWVRPFSWVFLVGILLALVMDLLLLPQFMSGNSKARKAG